MARAGAREGPFFRRSLRIGLSRVENRFKRKVKKKPPLPFLGCGGRRWRRKPQLGGPHPGPISARPDTRATHTPETTTIPRPGAGTTHGVSEAPKRNIRTKGEGTCAPRQAICFGSLPPAGLTAREKARIFAGNGRTIQPLEIPRARWACYGPDAHRGMSRSVPDK